MSPSDVLHEARPTPAPHSLVLFVGLGAKPEREMSDALVRAGVRSLWFGSPGQALAAAAHARFDAAVLKIDEPMSVAARRFDVWRQTLRCPLLVMADVDDEVDEIIALELGADAVLPPPVSARRLRAHLLMLLRRTHLEAGDWPLAGSPATTLQAAGWSLDRVQNRLQGNDRHVSLTELQSALLQVLLENAGRVVPRARLLAAVARGRDLHVRSVDVYIARLRVRLREERVDGLQIDGVRGRGYTLTVHPARRPGVPGLSGLHWVAPPADPLELPLARA